MRKIEAKTALAGRSKYPDKADARLVDRLLHPAVRPSFSIERGAKVFTIGSCFARNIEAKLSGFDIPTMRLVLPPGEIAQNIGNRILNEYNPGTISQRLNAAATNTGFGEKAISESKDGCLDLLLSGGARVPRQRLMARRREIDAIYSHVRTSSVLIVTLGLVEAWFDHEADIYLNMFPGVGPVNAAPGRYELRVLEQSDILPMLEASLAAVIESGVKKIILTVSPVPLQVSFSGEDCSVANMRSKATLLVTAQELARRVREVDYFPSYEMVISLGPDAFAEDNVHVLPSVVDVVTRHMLVNYVTC